MTGPAPGDWPLETLQAQAQPLFPGLRVEAVAQTDSTNTELMRRARAGAVPPATLLVAETQTAGRGRLGRSWVTGSRRAGPPATLQPPAPALYCGEGREGADMAEDDPKTLVSNGYAGEPALGLLHGADGRAQVSAVADGTVLRALPHRPAGRLRSATAFAPVMARPLATGSTVRVAGPPLGWSGAGSPRSGALEPEVHHPRGSHGPLQP